MMTDSIDSWAYVASLNDIPNGKKRCFTVAEHSVVACRVYDQVYIVKNLCPHQKQPLTDGRLQEYEITCPYHNACFDVRDGKALTGPSVWPLETYPCRIIDGKIYMRPGDRTDPEAPKDPRL